MTFDQYRALPAADKCKYLVKILAQKQGKSEPEIWGLAYFIVSRKLGYNIKQRAIEADLTVLRYLDKAGHIGTLKKTIKEIHDKPKKRRYK